MSFYTNVILVSKWEDRRPLSRTESRISRIVYNVSRQHLKTCTVCDDNVILINIFIFQHPNFSERARRAQSCRVKTTRPHPMLRNSQRRRSLSTTGFVEALDEMDEIKIINEKRSPDGNKRINSLK